MENHLSVLFNPKSIAVIGASRQKDSPGKSVLKSLLEGEYQGKVYPVNPKAEQILDLRAYASVKKIEESIDLAFIAVPRDGVLDVMKECAEKKVKAVVIISAGFKEVDEEGAELEKEIGVLAEENNMALIGPNCLGIINTHARLNGTFARQRPSAGNVSFISQSGAVGVYSLEFATRSQIGFASFVSLGNKALSNENDLLKTFMADEQTKVIIAYLEDFEKPQEFFALSEKLRATSPGKPLIVLKSGASKSGKRAAASHTGALAGSDKVLDDLFKQHGVLRVSDLESLFDVARIFSSEQKLQGERLCIVTNAGGPGIITADAAEKAGLQVPELSEELQQELSQHIPKTASANNPIDLVGDADSGRYEKVINTLLASDEIDVLLILCTPQLMTDMKQIARTVSHFAEPAQKRGKMILAAFADFDPVSPVKNIFADKKVPFYHFGNNAVDALAAAVSYYRMKTKPAVQITEAVQFKVDKEAIKKLLDKAAERNNNFLTEPESYQLFEDYGLQIAPYKLVQNKEQALKESKALKFPLVAKVVSEDIIHKSDAGGVVAHIKNEGDLKDALEQIREKVSENEPDAEIEGILLQEMVEKGTELIMGVQYDKQYGHLLMFGLGGIFVEVLEDVCFRKIPINQHEAELMIDSIRFQKMLEGVRGKAAVDKKILVDYLLRISQLISDFPQIKEIDLNPVFAVEKGAVVADARIILREE